VCEKMAMDDRHNVFFFHFLSIDILAKFDSKVAKLVEFTREKKFKIFLNYFGKNGEISPENKKHSTAASRTRQVGTVDHEGDGEPRERLGQSATRSAPVPGQAGRGSYSGRRTSAGCTRAESRDFWPTRVCGRSRASLLVTRQSAAILPSRARAKSQAHTL
jgi:hypothetical protein